jgi:hypothetical protein
MLGVNATTVEWMKASARTQAFGRDQAYEQTPIRAPTPEWLNAFGQLSSATDNYFIVENDRVNSAYGCLKDFGGTNFCTGTKIARQLSTSGVDVGGAFVIDAYRLWGTLITVTKYDVYVPSQAISDALNTGLVTPVLPCPQPNGIACGSWYNPTYPTGCSLPGVMGIAYQPIDGHSGIVVNVRMPTAYNAGHSVTMQDGDRFKEDVQTWFRGTAL